METLAGLFAGAVASLLLCEVEMALTLAVEDMSVEDMLGPAWPWLMALYTAAGAMAGLLLALLLWLLRRPLGVESALTAPMAVFRRFWILAIPFFLLFVYLNDEVLHPAMNPWVMGLDAIVVLAATVSAFRWIRRAAPGASRLGKELLVASIGLALISLVPLVFARQRPAGPPLPRVEAERPANVVLVVIDTLRAAQLGCYGYPRPTSPVIDRLAREGVRFTNARTPVTQTDPSHATMFTGVYSTRHGLTRNGWRLTEQNITLAERLREAGYRTFAAVSVQHLSEHFGFMQGMDDYHNNSPLDRFYLYGRSNHSFLSLPIILRSDVIAAFLGRPLQPNYRRADGATDDFLAWLSDHHDSVPFFAWIHYFDPHSPYEPLPDWEERFTHLPPALPPGMSWGEDAKRRFDGYDGEVAYADAQLGRIVEAIDWRGLRERTLIIVASDHGESLGEHDRSGHFGRPYEEVMRVPWILRLPGTLPAGAVFERPASLVDMTPTLLAFLGLPVPDGLDGRVLPLPLHGLVEMPFPPRAILARTETWRDELHLGVVKDGFKMVETRSLTTSRITSKPELYDLRSDPSELEDLAQTQGERLASLRRALRPILVGAAGQGELDEQTRQLLRSLGYVQ
jgi:arylsulfatase A-like enzyme